MADTSEASVFIAHKSPHANGAWSRAYTKLRTAKFNLELSIDMEPEVEEYELVTNKDQRYPDMTYEVLKGKGEVAGYIHEVPLHE